MSQYDPTWPFPQFDESGHQLLPSNWNQRQPKPNPTEGAEDAPF
ncbi:MAG: hypothetical protein ACOYBW_08860 [Fluviibacter phosphoraccumulans]